MIIEEAKHSFPLYDGAVITSFECTIGDERRLRGLVKSTEEARNEYKKAKQDKAKAAALLEEHTPEMFETSLGNIPPMTTVEVEIVYIQNLNVVMMEGGDAEGIALIIPTSIAPRYTYSQATPEIPCDGLNIRILVLKDDKVNPDGCQEESGHIVYDDGAKMLESPHRSHGEHDLNEYHSWAHHSDEPILKKDFVFIVQIQKGYSLHSEAISCPPDDSGLAAMMVNIRPNDLFRDAIIAQSFSGEILFLLDQSGSMDLGEYHLGKEGPRKIDVLRQAMHLVLAGLPKTCSFNIVSWGSETWAMWEQSKRPSSDSMKNAKEYIDGIKADMCGTDLLRALKAAVKRRSNITKSTQIVIITDGQLDPKEPIEFLCRMRRELQHKIRFFALGIGANVPHGLIENIAELGGGIGDIVNTAQMPRWEGKLNRLLRSALGKDAWDCDIDLGDGFERHSLMDYSLAKPSDTHQISYFQAPQAITGLNPFTFTSIFFLIDVKGRGDLPREVTIVTTTPEAKRNTYKLPVYQVKGRDGTMHQLAAKAALIDLESLTKKRSLSSRLIEDNANIIGTRYSIASRWTSFVAVPLDELDTTAEGMMMDHYRAMFSGVEFDNLLSKIDTANNDRPDGDSGSYIPLYHKRTLPLVEEVRHGSWYGSDVLSRELNLASGSTRLQPESLAISECCPTPVHQVLSQPVAEEIKQHSRSKSGTKQVFKRLWSKLRLRRLQRLERRESKDDATEAQIKAGTLGLEKTGGWPTPRLGDESPISSRYVLQPRSGSYASSNRSSSFPIDPLNWETAIEYSSDRGLFKLPDSAKRLLHLHFCPNTPLCFNEKLSENLHERKANEVLKPQLIDTLMMITCYQTHLARDEEIWDLMMERAKDTVTEFLAQDALESLEALLTASMMHEHYKAATGITESQEDGSTGVTTCPICKVQWQSSRTFFCPFDHESATSHAFNEWDKFWKHQKGHGHMVCPREGP